MLMLPLLLLLAAGGGALLFIAGRFRGRGLTSHGSDDITASVSYDTDKILRQLRRLLLTMDQALKELSPAFADASRHAMGNTFDEKLSNEEDLLLLFSGLLEAWYSKDGAYALDELGQIRYFLHRHQIDLSDDAAGHREWFDFVPTAEDCVLRPALVRSETGVLLKKGLAGLRQ